MDPMAGNFDVLSCCGLVGRLLRLHAANPRAEGRELADDVLIAALDIVRVLDRGRAVGGQRCDDHRRARAQIARAYLTAVQLRHAVDHRCFALDLDGRAHAVEFAGVAEAVVVDALGDEARPLGQSHADRDLRLHIGREAGVRQRLDVRPAETLRGLHADGIIIFRDARAHFAQLRGNTIQMLGNNIFLSHSMRHHILKLRLFR